MNIIWTFSHMFHDVFVYCLTDAEIEAMEKKREMTLEIQTLQVWHGWRCMWVEFTTSLYLFRILC